MRGTVWSVVDGVPVKREVLALEVQTELQFKDEARRLYHLAGDTVSLEFGPIAAPWGRA